MEAASQQGSHADNYMNKLLSFSALTVATLLGAVLWWNNSNSNNRQRVLYVSPQARNSNHPHRKSFPFVDVQNPIVTKKVTTEKALIYALESYRKETTVRLHGLSQALQQALQLEQAVPSMVPVNVLLSASIQNRIEKLSECLDSDLKMLMQLLQPFHPSVAIAAHEWCSTRGTAESAPSASPADSKLQVQKDTSMFHLVGATSGSRQQNVALFENAYDEAIQVVAHLVRDWTKLGSQVRESIYTWCTRQLETYYPKKASPVLVPGSGLGRLAYEIYEMGYTVEANELSPVMASAAAAILQRGFAGTVHPFVLDDLSNEVQSDRRYDQVTFPDVQVVMGSHRGSLSYTVGDFMGSYYGDISLKESYGAVVTCFFIDTATDLYEYLEQIRRLLKPGGVWINVGPLQWHRNAMLFPSADELRNLIEAYGFRIERWTIDNEPLHYRDNGVEEHGFVRTTNFVGYRPLRFVAIRT